MRSVSHVCAPVVLCRRNLRQHMQQMKQPCIPYLGVFLTDLTYLLAAAEKASDDSAAQVFREQMMSTADQVAKWQMSAYGTLAGWVLCDLCVPSFLCII